jgi:Protein of unknown function (DUF4238)
MLYTVNLAKDTAEIIETPVARTFGLTDMYRDFANASNQHYLEEQLSKLESRAGMVVSKILKSLEAGDKEVWIPRSDRDILRKFLFIMKYRNSGMHKRFGHQNMEEYSQNDRVRFLKYMREKEFKKPIDVWFNNIKAMLELKMDPGGKWMAELQKHAYPDDAKWFISHAQMFYLALCTPSNQEDEFLLTENSYGVHEGPASPHENPDTGEPDEIYTEYHLFAAISPKLMLVLRSFVLPVPEEDFDDNIREWRKDMHYQTYSQHKNPMAPFSRLADLPIAKARNSYSKVVDSRLELLDGEDGTPRAHHKFCFRFFPISTKHVNMINDIMLEQSIAISAIVFKTYPGARRALEHYLKTTETGVKFIRDTPDDPRLACVKKLEQAAREMGSDVTAVYKLWDKPISEDERKRRLEALNQVIQENIPTDTEFMKLYSKLGKQI